VGLVENLLEACERLVRLLFLFCFECLAGKIGIEARCWSRWGVIECEFGVAVWLVRGCSVGVFDWCVRFYFRVWLAVVFVFSPVWVCVGFCVVFGRLFGFDYDGEFQV
jgi:hypothetical protein